MAPFNARLGRTLAALLLVAAPACIDANYAARSQAAGSLAIDDKTGLLLAADGDNDALAIIDPAKEGAERVKLVQTGRRPERVIKTDAGIFVSNRQGRSVTQLDATTHEVIRQIPVGAEPIGLRVANGVLLVAEATGQSVRAIDLSDASTKWVAKLGDEVHGLGVLPDGRVYVPGFKSGRMHVLDVNSGAETTSFSLAQPVDLRSGVDFDRAPLFGQDVTVAPDGRAYIVHSQTSNIELPPITAGYYSAGPSPAIAPGVTTIEPARNTILSERQPAAFEQVDPGESPFPPSMVRPSEPIAGPEVAVTDARGEYLYVVNKLSNTVSVMSTTRRQFGSDSSFGTSLGSQGILANLRVGKGPTGIALSADNTMAYVWNSFEHTITVIAADPVGNLVAMRTLTGADGKPLTPHTLTAEARRGRELFHDATSSAMSNTAAGGVACASCHPGGREDGHTWKFAEGLRNTPILAGKHLAETKPFHWDGQLVDMPAFQHVVERRMGGTGLSRSDFDAMLTWLDSEPMPDNPNRPDGGGLTDLQLAGRDLFEGKANCASCHAGANLTDNKFWDVGTGLTMVPIEMDGAGIAINASDRRFAVPNTPTLVGLWASGPYLHDGSVATLRDRVEQNPGDKHGLTSQLSATEKTALVAYLETL